MDFSQYLNSLPANQLSALYESPWTCQAVLRSLPPLAQQVVLRLLHIDDPVPDTLLRGLVKPESKQKCSSSIDLLENLQVIQRASSSTWQLELEFRSRLRQCVANPMYLGLGGSEAGPAMPATVAECNAYGEQQWQTVLLSLVEGRRGSLRPHKLLSGLDVNSLFYEAGLLDGGDLTEDGFQFLFTDLYSQLWLLLQHYLSHSAQQSGSLFANALSFLLQMAFRKAHDVWSHITSRASVTAWHAHLLVQTPSHGVMLCPQQPPVQATQPLDVSQLSEDQKATASHMCALGILKPAEQRGQLFLCPTFLAGLLCGTGAAPTAANASIAGFIVVETSFRLYAYTSSPVQIAILQLFAKTDCLLPNVFVGTLTGKSVTEALNRKISSGMIIRYLEDHRHPKVAHRSPVLPEAVKDQIILWERELNRLSCTTAAMFTSFETEGYFKAAVKKAQELGGMLHCDSSSQRLVAAGTVVDELQRYIDGLRKRSQKR